MPNLNKLHIADANPKTDYNYKEVNQRKSGMWSEAKDLKVGDILWNTALGDKGIKVWDRITKVTKDLSKVHLEFEKAPAVTLDGGDFCSITRGY